MTPRLALVLGLLLPLSCKLGSDAPSVVRAEAAASPGYLALSAGVSLRDEAAKKFLYCAGDALLAAANSPFDIASAAAGFEAAPTLFAELKGRAPAPDVPPPREPSLDGFELGAFVADAYFLQLPVERLTEGAAAVGSAAVDRLIRWLQGLTVNALRITTHAIAMLEAQGGGERRVVELLVAQAKLKSLANKIELLKARDVAGKIAPVLDCSIAIGKAAGLFKEDDAVPPRGDLARVERLKLGTLRAHADDGTSRLRLHGVHAACFGIAKGEACVTEKKTWPRRGDDGTCVSCCEARLGKNATLRAAGPRTVALATGYCKEICNGVRVGDVVLGGEPVASCTAFMERAEAHKNAWGWEPFDLADQPGTRPKSSDEVERHRQTLVESLKLAREHFAIFDTGASPSAKPDGHASYGDFEAVAAARHVLPSVRHAALHLTQKVAGDQFRFLRQLDTASDGRGLYSFDQTISLADVEALLKAVFEYRDEVEL